MSAAKFRPVHWSDLRSGQLVGWGIERKLAGERRYKPVGYEGQIHPFKTKAEAQKVCNQLSKDDYDDTH